MMKLFTRTLLFMSLSAFSCFALAGVASDIDSVPDYGSEKPDEDWSGMLGLALLSSPEYIGSEDTEGTGVPIIIVDYKDTAYFKVNRGGYWFWKPNDNLRVGALIKLRAGAWEEDDDSIEDLGPLPASFDEPDMQAEPGVNLLYKAGKVKAEVQLLAGEDTNVVANLDFRALQTEKTTLTIRFEVESLGEDTVNYNWYGDTSGADVDSATNTSLAVIGTYSLSKEWGLIYGAKTTSLDEEIEDSPIGDDDTYTVGFFGATWMF
jgi:outer membrane scaffolding protein for murein synthesis (MipA/OmpV family)